MPQRLRSITCTGNTVGLVGDGGPADPDIKQSGYGKNAVSDLAGIMNASIGPLF